MSCTLDIAHSLLFCAGHQIPGDKTNNTDHARMSVARALISGLTPMRTLEKTSIGKVVARDRDKAGDHQVISDSVKASSQPEITPA
ncbi:Uncharacterised protein [Klebsiella pneumoniae subsp. pneumoniae]|uniref:Uncharacterized protein n=1 Tax=Klebsiella pneumoniae subsp. pneumoniae TaxID=72407 RepID=A0A378A1X8_KLEPN|nr:Uncharacterised protein [Klebsiella pneumoniae subsp. pneumoniae]